MSYPSPTPRSEPPPEAPVTPAYGSPLPGPAVPGPQPYAVGKAAPTYPPTAGYPVVDPPYPPPPPRRRRTGLVTGIAVTVTVIVLLCIGGTVVAASLSRGGGGGAKAAAPPAPSQSQESQPAQAPPSPTRPPAATDHVIVYEVTGDGPVNITYVKNPKGAISRVGRADLPWRTELNMGQNPFVATVLAIRLGVMRGSLTCRLLVDGVQVSKRTSKGRFAAVTCDDLVLG